MLELGDRTGGAEARATGAFAPFELVAGDMATGLVIVCDHASNALPREYGTLGLDEAQLGRHIGYDIGARDVALTIAEALGAPAVLAGFSRLLIDPNRGEDDPTLVMRISDGAVVPGNAAVDAAEIARRKAACYMPYHDAVKGLIDEAVAAGHEPALISMHSYTQSWRGIPRPWHAGVLWDRDPRIAVPLLEALRRDGDLVIGDNEPYSGQLPGDTMYRHGTLRGLAHALIEIRQDLIGDRAGVESWSRRLADILRALMPLDR